MSGDDDDVFSVNDADSDGNDDVDDDDSSNED